MSDDDGTKPVFSVIVPSYNGRDRIAGTLEALGRQRTGVPYEIVVVDSGEQSASDAIRSSGLAIEVVRHLDRLRPGPARNAGVQAARGEFVAFCPDDGIPVEGWLQARLDKHREGYDVVGGSISNGTPESRIGTAGYLLEYSAMLPIGPLLAEQEIPHALSFRRSVLQRLGPYPEDTLTGEDTILNRRCAREGIRVGFAPDAAIAHLNPTRLADMLKHAFEHGRGLQQCVARHDLTSSVEGPMCWGVAAMRMLVLYPARGWMTKQARLRRHAPGLLPTFLYLSPLIMLGLASTGWGAWQELRTLTARPGAEQARGRSYP